jgi:hypothetical protein
MDPITLSALVVSIITAFGVLLSRLKFRRCMCCCIESDCIKTPHVTPEPSIDYEYNNEISEIL